MRNGQFVIVVAIADAVKQKPPIFDTLGQHRLPLQRHPIIGGPVRSIRLFGVNNETPAAGVIVKLVSLP